MNASAYGWFLHGERLGLIDLLHWRRRMLLGVRTVARCPYCSAVIGTPAWRRHVEECRP